MSVLSKFREYKGTQIKPTYVPTETKVLPTINPKPVNVESGLADVIPKYVAQPKSTVVPGKYLLAVSDYISKNPKFKVSDKMPGVESDTGYKSFEQILAEYDKKKEPTKPFLDGAFTGSEIKPMNAEQSQELKNRGTVQKGKLVLNQFGSALAGNGIPNLVENVVGKSIEKEFGADSRQMQLYNADQPLTETQRINQAMGRSTNAELSSTDKALAFGSKVAGGLVGQGLLYGALGVPLRTTQIGAKILGGASSSALRKFIGGQGLDLFIDTVIQTPIEAINSISNDEGIDEFGKKWLQNRAIDATFNLAIGGAAEGFKKLKEIITDPRIAKELSEAGIDTAKLSNDIDMNNVDEIAKAKAKVEEAGKTLDTIYVDKGGSASTDINKLNTTPVDTNAPLQLNAPEGQSPMQAFTEWRKQNFGGAFGKVSEADDVALKQLYREDTGINLLPRQVETPRNVLPSEMSATKPTIEQKVTGTETPTKQEVQAETKLEPTDVEVDEPLLKKFRLDLFGASPEQPVKAMLNGKEVSITKVTEVNGTPVAKVDGLLMPVETSKLKPTKDYTSKNIFPYKDKVVDATDDELAKSFSDKVSTDTKPKTKKKLSERATEIRKQFEDDLIPLQTLEKSIKGKISSAEDSVYKQARLYKGAPERANEIVRTRLAPIVDDVIDKGFTQKELGDYALAIHAKDVNNAGINSGFTNQEVDAIIKKYANTPLEESRKKLVELSDDMLKDLVDSGYLSKEQFETIKSKWANYMPLFRSFDDDKVDMAYGLSKAFSNVSNPIKALKGSERDVIDPIESMVKNIYRITDTKMKNEVGVQLAKLSESAPDVIRKLAPDESIGRKNVVTVKVNGEKVQFEVEPEIFKVFNGLDKEASNTLINLLSKPASLLRAGATLTPEFALRNPFRDVQNAYIVSNSGFNPFTDFPAGLAQTLKKGELYQQWLKEGGGYGNVMSMDRQAHKEALQNALKQPVSGKFVNVVNPKSWLATLRAISDVTESATKVGEFRAALRSGATPQEAAYRARDLMDFARAGNAIRPANKIVAFLNANIQGKSKLIRSIKENPARVTAKIAQTMVLPTVAVSVYNNQFASDEQKAVIKDAPDWLRNTFWLVAIPGSDMVARIPKPFDVSAFANITDRFMEFASGRDPEAFDGFAKALLKDQSLPTMISGILPLIEAQANYSFFREAPIIPMGEQYRQKKDQYDVRTSEVAKAAAGLVEKAGFENSNFASPRVMDYVIRSSTAGLGSYVLDSVDAVIGAIDKDKNKKPSATTEQLPILKAFTVNPLTSGKSFGYVYDAKDSLAQEKASWKLKLSDEDEARYKKGRLDFPKQDLLDTANDIADELSDISKEIKKIENDIKLMPNQKRDKILLLNGERDKISREGSEMLKKLIKKGD